MLGVLFYILIIVCAVIVFFEQRNYEKLTGFSSSPFLTAFGVLILWIAIFPYYLFKIRRDQYDNIEGMDRSPYIISINQGKLYLIIGVFLLFMNYAILAYIYF